MSTKVKNLNRRHAFLTSATFVALVSIFGFTGCQGSGGGAAVQTPPIVPVATVQTPPDSAEHQTFDGAKAMDILKKQCDFGVRPIGTEAHEKLKDYLIAEMKKYADDTVLQEFKYRGMPITNVIGVFNPAGSDKPSAKPILLMTHWDTRPIADGPFSSQIKSGVVYKFGAKGWNKTHPIMGANDAASGVGVLLELARMFKANKPPVGVVILLDDGEDYGDFAANDRKGEGVELGARYFAQNFKKEKRFGFPTYGILLDMVGAKNAIFVRELNSEKYARNVNDRVFALGGKLHYENFFKTDGTQDVGDDHISINEAGIPTIDIIHPLPFGEHESTGYTFWHTLQDTPDKCSADTLKAVGDTVAEVIYRESP